MKKRVLAVVLTGLMAAGMLAGCGSKKSSSDSDVEYIKNKGSLIVGITDFEPMDYKDKDWL